MGKRNRERIAALKEGLLNPIRNTAIKIAARGGVVEALREGSTADQIGRVGELVGYGALPPAKLKAAIMKQAPKEMDTAIKKFKKQGKEITVDLLCREVKKEPGFLAMCEKIGLDLAWFENLATERMEAKGV